MKLFRDNMPGVITGKGPGFARAMKQHIKRQRDRSRVGTWRCNIPSAWKTNDGPHIDPDWFIVGEVLA